MRRTPLAGIVLLAVALGGTGCSQPAVPSDQVAASEFSPDESAAPSPGTSPDDASDAPSTGVAIKFDKVKSKRWGAEPFEVKAVASNGAKLKYTAKGACTVTPRGGRVKIQKVGNCVITAKTTSGEPGSKSVTIKIRPAKPKIEFASHSVRWKPGNSYALGAEVSLGIPLSYEIVKAGSDANCKVRKGALTLIDDAPQLPLPCKVKVAAASTSPNYQTPEPVVATITVKYPSWDVEASSPDVSWSETGGKVRVKVREHSGTAAEMKIRGSQSKDPGPCGESDDYSPNPAPLGTTTFFVVLEVPQPTAEDGPDGYTCNMTAQAGPENYAGPSGSVDDFTLTVRP